MYQHIQHIKLVDVLLAQDLEVLDLIQVLRMVPGKEYQMGWKFLVQILIVKNLESFVRREEKEVQALSKYVLNQQRESYEEVKLRIDKIKEKYKALRQQKVEEAIRERLTQFGVEVKDSDTKEILLEKERV